MEPISAGISAVAALFKGVSSFFGHNNEAKAEKNAARQAQAEAGVAADEDLQQGDAVAAQGAVNAAANGGGFTGSAISAISALSAAAMFRARAAAYRGETESQAHLYNAKVAKAQGLSDLIGGVIGSAGSLVKGGAQYQARQRAGVPLVPQLPTPAASGDTEGLY